MGASTKVTVKVAIHEMSETISHQSSPVASAFTMRPPEALVSKLVFKTHIIETAQPGVLKVDGRAVATMVGVEMSGSYGIASSKTGKEISVESSGTGSLASTQTSVIGSHSLLSSPAILAQEELVMTSATSVGPSPVDHVGAAIATAVGFDHEELSSSSTEWEHSLGNG